MRVTHVIIRGMDGSLFVEVSDSLHPYVRAVREPNPIWRRGRARRAWKSDASQTQGWE